MKIRVRVCSMASELEGILNSIPEDNLLTITESSVHVGYTTFYHYTVIYKSKY